MHYSKWQLSLAIAVLLCRCGPAAAQSADPQTATPAPASREPAFTVRSVSVSSGYSFVQLPPITLGGYLPSQALENDLTATAAGDVGWRKSHRGFFCDVDLNGYYSGQVKYSQIGGLGSSGSFTVKQSFHRRWSAVVAGTYFLANSEQSAFLPPSDDPTAAAADPLVGAATLAHSRNPDESQAALFIPIRQSPDLLAGYGRQMIGSSAVADLTYSHSSRFSTSAGVGFASGRSLPINNEPQGALPFPSSRVQTENLSVRYSLSPRATISAAAAHGETTGLFENSGTSGSGGFDWLGRRWFSSIAAGVIIQSSENRPDATYSISGGYKTTSQTFVLAASRQLFDPLGYGGQNRVTGFRGTYFQVTGGWFWSPPRGPWTVHFDASYWRRPGNFSYILAGSSTTVIARQLTPTLRGQAQLTLIKNGSRSFEGFYLSREALQFNLVWAPARGHHKRVGGPGPAGR